QALHLLDQVGLLVPEDLPDLLLVHPTHSATPQGIQRVSTSSSQWLRRVSAHASEARTPATVSVVLSQGGSETGEVNTPTRSAKASIRVTSSSSRGTSKTRRTRRTSMAAPPSHRLRVG